MVQRDPDDHYPTWRGKAFQLIGFRCLGELLPGGSLPILSWACRFIGYMGLARTVILASIASVLACSLIVSAKSRTCLGLTIAMGRLAAACFCLVEHFDVRIFTCKCSQSFLTMQLSFFISYCANMDPTLQ